MEAVTFDVIDHATQPRSILLQLAIYKLAFLVDEVTSLRRSILVNKLICIVSSHPLLQKNNLHCQMTSEASALTGILGYVLEQVVQTGDGEPKYLENITLDEA